MNVEYPGKKQAANPRIQNSQYRESKLRKYTATQATQQKTKKDGDTRYTRGEEGRGNRW